MPPPLWSRGGTTQAHGPRRQQPTGSRRRQAQHRRPLGPQAGRRSAGWGRRWRHWDKSWANPERRGRGLCRHQPHLRQGPRRQTGAVPLPGQGPPDHTEDRRSAVPRWRGRSLRLHSSRGMEGPAGSTDAQEPPMRTTDRAGQASRDQQRGSTGPRFEQSSCSGHAGEVETLLDGLKKPFMLVFGDQIEHGASAIRLSLASYHSRRHSVT